MTETPTSYSLLVMFKDVIYAVRDPYGNRPLCIGRLVPISKLHGSGILNMFVLLKKLTSATDNKEISQDITAVCSHRPGFDFIRG